jgi:hypothetical protein
MCRTIAAASGGDSRLSSSAWSCKCVAFEAGLQAIKCLTRVCIDGGNCYVQVGEVAVAVAVGVHVYISMSVSSSISTSCSERRKVSMVAVVVYMLTT